MSRPSPNSLKTYAKLRCHLCSPCQELIIESGDLRGPGPLSALLRQSRRLRNLTLASCRLPALGPSLAPAPHLVHLNLSHNHIKRCH